MTKVQGSSEKVGVLKPKAAKSQFVETVLPVQQHVKQQADTNQSCFSRDQKEEIEAYCPVSMQRMEIDTAAHGIIDGICHQMIQIDNYGRSEDNPGKQPFFWVKNRSNQAGQNEMKSNMQHSIILTDNACLIHDREEPSIKGNQFLKSQK